MPYAIEYGPKGKRLTIRDLRLSEIVPKADALIASGERHVRILRPDGVPTDLHQFRLDVGLPPAE